MKSEQFWKDQADLWYGIAKQLIRSNQMLQQKLTDAEQKPSDSESSGAKFSYGDPEYALEHDEGRE